MSSRGKIPSRFHGFIPIGQSNKITSGITLHSNFFLFYLIDHMGQSAQKITRKKKEEHAINIHTDNKKDSTMKHTNEKNKKKEQGKKKEAQDRRTRIFVDSFLFPISFLFLYDYQLLNVLNL